MIFRCFVLFISNVPLLVLKLGSTSCLETRSHLREYNRGLFHVIKLGVSGNVPWVY